VKRHIGLAILSVLVAFSAIGQSVDAIGWSQGVVYEYDGSGNVKKIGTDSYYYDSAQRLIKGSVAGSQQSYEYDSFGNRTKCTTPAPADCQYGITIDSATNRIKDRSHDNRGNLTQLPEGNTLDYDELGMLRKETGSNRAVYYIYTADDERIAVYDADTALKQHKWRWTVRALDKKPLREFTSDGTNGTGNFKWLRDQVWRDGALLASRQVDSTAPTGVSTYHYHVDHLGTPRRVTTTSASIIGVHDYLPFGPEITGSGNANEPQLETLKFTGHERDFASDRPPLDYMHARYYEGRAGRFLSIDPGRDWDPKSPQSWNMYAYVRNNPINRSDPDGKFVCVSGNGAPCSKAASKTIALGVEKMKGSLATMNKEDPRRKQLQQVIDAYGKPGDPNTKINTVIVNPINSDGSPALPGKVLGAAGRGVVGVSLSKIAAKAGPNNDEKAFTILGGTLTHEGLHNLQIDFLSSKGPISMLSTFHKELQAYTLEKGYYDALGSGAMAPDPTKGAWASTMEACRQVGCVP
jgi:RHS repeat-associated protein